MSKAKEVPVEDKEECKYCKKEFSNAGIKNHEKYCSENPKVIEKKEIEDNKGVKVTPTVSNILKVNGNEYSLQEGIECEVPKDVAKTLKGFKLAK